MIYIFDYNALVEEDGKTFLVDDGLQKRRLNQLAEFVKLLDSIRGMLEDNELPPCLAGQIITEGAQAVKAWTTQSVRDGLAGASMPGFAKTEFADMASRMLPQSVVNASEEYCEQAGRLLDGLPVDGSDFATDENGILHLDTESVKAKIVQGCRHEVTEQDQRFADEVAKIAELVRALELKGVNARELVGKYAVAGCPEDELTKFRDICTRTHAPGTFYTEYVNNELLNKILANGN